MSRPVEDLSAEIIGPAVETAGLSPLTTAVAEKFSAYYDLLARWNAKLNLTAIRNPEDTLRRHFLECIFCAQQLPAGIKTLLDYGSGAGFPGIPILLCRPDIRVTLAESQRKKASFLREAVRQLGLDAEVYSGRVEEMPDSRVFGAVALRAVDRMQVAVQGAALRLIEGGWLVILASSGSISLPDGFSSTPIVAPGLENGVLMLARRTYVSRGTSGGEG